MLLQSVSIGPGARNPDFVAYEQQLRRKAWLQTPRTGVLGTAPSILFRIIITRTITLCFLGSIPSNFWLD